MFRVRQRLKLAGAILIPFVKYGLAAPNLRSNRGQELGLRRKTIRFQTRRFAGCSNSGEIHVGRYVLLAGVSEKVWGELMAAICPQCSFLAFRGNELLGLQAIINGQKFPARQSARRLAPPFLSRRT